MTIFEDPLEIHYNAEQCVKGRPHINLLRQAVRKNSADKRDLAVIMDYDTLERVADGLETELEDDGRVVAYSELERATRKIEKELGQVFVHRIDSNKDFALVMNPSAVYYDNSIDKQKQVVAAEVHPR
jgi:hypothetical protein